MNGGVVIFTDGASKGNPGPGGWGALVVEGGTATELGARVDGTTNNRMELMAALEALKFLGTKRRGSKAIVYTDSSYLINGITKWIHGWKRGGWITKKKEDVANADLWKALADASDRTGIEVEWTYVGGHIGIPGNERVDEIASDFAAGKRVELFAGPVSGYGIDVSHVEFDEAKKRAKASGKSRSKGPAYSYVSALGGKVMVHKTWAECEARVKGKPARFKKASSPEEEAELIREFSKS